MGTNILLSGESAPGSINGINAINAINSISYAAGVGDPNSFGAPGTDIRSVDEAATALRPELRELQRELRRRVDGARLRADLLQLLRVELEESCTQTDAAVRARFAALREQLNDRMRQLLD